MMVVVPAVAVMVDGFAGNVAEKPHEMAAPVLMAGMDSEPHACEEIAQGKEQGQRRFGCLFHLCKSKDI